MVYPNVPAGLPAQVILRQHVEGRLSQTNGGIVVNRNDRGQYLLPPQPGGSFFAICAVRAKAPTALALKTSGNKNWHVTSNVKAFVNGMNVPNGGAVRLPKGNSRIVVQITAGHRGHPSSGAAMRFAACVMVAAIVLGGVACAADELPNDTDKIKTLTADQAKALSQRQGYLSLAGLTTLSDDAAKALAQHKGQLYLAGLTTLSDKTAKALAQHKGDLYLAGVTTLSEAAAKALRANPKILLPQKFNAVQQGRQSGRRGS